MWFGLVRLQVEIHSALDPKAHSLPERLAHMLSQLTALHDQIQEDVTIAEAQLAEKKQ
jgi:hypothetical protein